MSTLSPAGQSLVSELSSRYGVSTDAAEHMLGAVYRGNGSMAQFNHSEFGGSGQWMSGGMTMVSDLFNHQLKSLVNNLCSDIANHLANHQTEPFASSFQSQSQSGSGGQSQSSGGGSGGNSLFVPDARSNWWPQDLGSPSATGSQNNIQYAYFSSARRLAVKTGSDVWLYDTGQHQIGGFGQQQGGGSSITFSSQYGTVNLSSLSVVSRNGQAVPKSASVPPPNRSNEHADSPSNDQSHFQSHAAAFAGQPNSTGQPNSSSASNGPSGQSHQDILDTIAKLGDLRDKGFLSEKEFDSKKSDLLNRL